MSSPLGRSKYVSFSQNLKKVLGFLVLPALLIVAGFGIYNILNNQRTAQAATCTWTGDVNGNISNVGNWSGCTTGSGLPELGDNVIFPNVATTYVINVDMSNIFNNIEFESLTTSDYTFSGLTLNASGELITAASTNSIIFSNEMDACGLTGAGTIELQNNDLQLGCGSGNYTFSGTINGTGDVNKRADGIQSFQNVTTASNITVNVTSFFLRIEGNTTVNGQLNNTAGGLIVSDTLNLPNNTYVQSGGNTNIGPGNLANLNAYNIPTGNLEIDISSGSAGKAVVDSGTTSLSGATFSARFFGTYSVGQSFVVLDTSNSGQLSDEFSNFLSGNTITVNGWNVSGSTIVNDVVISVSYSSTQMVITIDEIIPKACIGNTNYTTPTGTVTTGVINYFPDSNCNWTITPANADSVTLNFSSFDTESGVDIVNVYDGITTNSPLLGTFSGNSLPSSLTANSGLMLITFNSDSVTELSGFNATWTSVGFPGPTITNVNPAFGPTAGGTNVTLTGTNFVSGQYQDIESVGNTGFDGLKGMVVDASGQYITGEFTGSITLGSTTLTSSGGTDIYIAKLDLSGNYEWAVKAGGTGTDGYNRRQSLYFNQFDGSIMIAGFYQGSADFGATTLTGGSGANIFIAKMNKTTGAFTWAKSAGGDTAGTVFTGDTFPTQYGGSIDTDSSGNIYFSGKVDGTLPSFGAINITLNNGDADMFVAKMDSNGNYIWVKNYGSSTNPQNMLVHGLVVDDSNRIYAASGFAGSMTVGATTLNSLGNTDVSNSAIIKLEDDGTELWAISGGTVGALVGANDLPYDLALDSNQDLYLTGYYGGSTATFGAFTVTGSPVGSTIITAKISPAGSFTWVRQLITSSTFGTTRDMYIDSSDNIYIGGVYSNTLTDGTEVISGTGANAFFGKYDTSGNLLDLETIGGTAGQLLVAGVGGNQVRALGEYNGKLYIAGEYFDTVGIGGQTITSAGDQDGFYTTWVSDKVSVKIDGNEVNANFVSSTQLTLITPPGTLGLKDVIITNQNGQSFTLSNGFEYQSTTTPVTNSDIVSLVCSPSTATVNTNVNCVVTTNVNLNTLSGSINLRVGVSGTVVNCPISGSGTTLNCNNIPVGGTIGTFPAQYNASGSGGTYANGNNITTEPAGTCTGTPSGPSLDGETIVIFCVDSGALTLYPGDATDNNDLCETGNVSTNNYFVDDSGNISLTPSTCSPAEQGVNFSAISVSPNRQNVTTTIHDILFEDLTGSENNTYSVSATIGNLINQGSGSNITLGSNPDGASLETTEDPDAPTAVNAGKLYCTMDPSTGAIAAIVPTAARTQPGLTNLMQGPKTTVISNATSVSIFNTSGNDVLAGRYDIDNVNFKCRIPAYVDQGTYKQDIVLTVVAS